MVYESYSAKDTFHFGKLIGLAAEAGMIICLEGELGTGKTVLAKGLADGLGVCGPVASPTFTILQVYEDGRLPLYHFDVYRIIDIEEMEEIGYYDYFYGNGVCLVEWSSRIEEILPQRCFHAAIEKDLSKGLDYRKITLTGMELRENGSLTVCSGTKSQENGSFTACQGKIQEGRL